MDLRSTMILLGSFAIGDLESYNFEIGKVWYRVKHCRAWYFYLFILWKIIIVISENLKLLIKTTTLFIKFSNCFWKLIILI